MLTPAWVINNKYANMRFCIFKPTLEVFKLVCRFLDFKVIFSNIHWWNLYVKKYLQLREKGACFQWASYQFIRSNSFSNFRMKAAKEFFRSATRLIIASTDDSNCFSSCGCEKWTLHFQLHIVFWLKFNFRGETRITFFGSLAAF